MNSEMRETLRGADTRILVGKLYICVLTLLASPRPVLFIFSDAIAVLYCRYG
jgi:hypothetical protein